MKNKSESVSEKYIKLKFRIFLCINNNNNPRRNLYTHHVRFMMNSRRVFFTTGND